MLKKPEFTNEDFDRLKEYNDEIIEFSRFILGKYFEYKKLMGDGLSRESVGLYTVKNPLSTENKIFGDYTIEVFIIMRSFGPGPQSFLIDDYVPTEFVFSTQEYKKRYLGAKRIVDKSTGAYYPMG